MVIKLNVKRGCKVTGLSFHGERSWILASLSNGMIELWDYSTGLLIDSFHGDLKGSVCSVNFHKIEPFFVSGGDDREIKVWNYKLRECMFSLRGHSDRINTVQFHEKETWIISCSNDKTVRIWNWESRSCIFVHRLWPFRVRSASFHLKEYIALAVLTDSVRVWDIVSLRKKPRSTWYDDNSSRGSLPHRRVTCASFHPSLPLVMTAGDNTQIGIAIFDLKGIRPLWKGSMDGQTQGISCLTFHAKLDVCFSGSQDYKTIRAWDLKTRTCLGKFNWYETFCFLASHPSSHLLGAGHDNGFIVFKLARERPAFSVIGDSMLYVKNRALYFFDYFTLKDVELMSFSTLHVQGYRALSYNPAENAVLICSNVDLDYYELYNIPKESCVQQAKTGVGGSSVFLSQNRFAVLNNSCNQVLVKNLRNHTVKKIVLPIAADIIFTAGSGNLLCRAKDKVVLFDPQQQIVLGDIYTSLVRHVVWSGNMENVALISKYSIVLADKKLVLRCKVDEKNCIKSGSWDENGVFVYTTKIHIKYCLPHNGETGIIKTVGVPKYITKIYGSKIFCLDRDGKICPVIIDSTEYIFQLSLLENTGSSVYIAPSPGMPAIQSGVENSEFIAPSPGLPAIQSWVEDSSNAAGQAAAGNFDVAFCLLDDLHGVKKFSRLKSSFIDLHLGSQTYLCAFPSAPVISMPMDRRWNEHSNLGGPVLIFNYSRVEEKVKAARELFLDERFADAFYLFQEALYVIPFSIAASLKEAQHLAWLFCVVKNYLVVTKLQLKRGELKDNLVRQLELVAYSTHVPLSTHDSRLVLFNAMTDFYKAGNKRTAAEFARRILHANPSTLEETKAADKAFLDSVEDRKDVPKLNNGLTNLFKNVTKFVWKSNSSTGDDYSKAARQVLEDRKKYRKDVWRLNYDPAKTFTICGSTLEQMYKGQNLAVCAFCRAFSLPSQKDKLCTVCDLAVIEDLCFSNRYAVFPIKII